MIADIVYVLCAVTSVACILLLARAWRESRTPLLFWCLMCFVGLALNNILLLVDKIVVTDHDLSVLRTLPAALGVGALVWGLVWETRE